jgi:hypothetical protein
MRIDAPVVEEKVAQEEEDIEIQWFVSGDTRYRT